MKTIAFDLGKARTGVAISDASGFLATPSAVIVKSDPAAIIDGAVSAVMASGAERIVVGLPLRTDGGESEMAQAARAFAAELEKRCGLPVLLCDERFSTAEAHRLYNEAGKKGAIKRRQTIDSAAAAVILQSFLDSKK